LAEWHTERGNDAAALDVLEDMLLVVPLQQDLHAELGDRLLEDGRPRKALVEYEAFMALEPHDLASAHFRLAQAYRALEDLPRTREHLLYALEIAPHLREAQDLLLEIID
jgi:tetratricopeptide (TPR) repeat protein